MYKIFRAMPWYLRLFILVAIGLPLIQTSILTQWLPKDPLVHIEAFTAYGAFLWLFIALCVGLDKFLGLISTGFVLAVGTVIMGAAVRGTLGLVGETEELRVAMSMHLFNVLMMLVLSVPLFGFAAHCFSASHVLESASKRAGIGSTWQVFIAILLRVSQHFTDLFPTLLTVWSEEHPTRILPRCRDDWKAAAWPTKPFKLVDWFVTAFWAWARCLLVFGLKVVPSVQSETTRYMRPAPSKEQL